MKKILYQIHSIPHRRVFKSYVEREDLEQMIIAPPPIMLDGIMEDYSGFGINDIRTYRNTSDAQKLVDAFKPDVFVSADFPKMVSVPPKCKKAYVNHGTIPGHIMTLAKYNSNSRWNDFDLHCGATDRFGDLIRYITGKKYEILTNALGQLDLVSNKDLYAPSKDNILFNIDRPSILFCGFCCKNNSDFKLHNEDYFKTLVELEALAKKHNWLVIVKPRQVIGKVIAFLKEIGGWGTKYVSIYPKLVASKYLHFIDALADPYRYFASDIIMCNGCSTLEIESCVAGKPLVVVRTKVGPDYDPYSTVSSGAASLVSNIEATGSVILDILSGKNIRTDKQKSLLDKMGIRSDGLAHKRIQDRLKLL